MASVPGDEASVAAAVRRHPGRLVGMTMVDPTAPDARTRVPRALGADRLRCVCLFPAMHGYALDHDGVDRVFAAAAEAGAAVLIHCGVLTIGVRRKLGLATHVDIRLGDPLADLAQRVPIPRGPGGDSALRRRVPQRGANGGRHLPKHPPGHIQLERMAAIPAWADPRRRVSIDARDARTGPPAVRHRFVVLPAWLATTGLRRADVHSPRPGNRRRRPRADPWG